VNKTPSIYTVIAAICLSIGLIILGFILKSAALDVKGIAPNKVKNALSKVSQLAKQNIAIVQDSYGAQPEYIFTGLNDIKPAMVQEATEKAREVANKFAKDSGSTKYLIANTNIFRHK